MSWLDSITPNFLLSEDKRIQKEQRRVTHRDLQPEDREAAARWLSDNGSPKALVALLTRFDMQLEHQMNDRDEREFVYQLLVGHGPEALRRPLRAHLKRCRMIAMPMRMYAELYGDEAAVEMAFELLAAERERDDFKPGKKIDLLVWLVDHTHPGAIEACAPFLEDFDEGVRYAAAEVLLAQKDDAARPLLEKVLANPGEEANRLKVRLCEAFQRRGWPLDDPDAVAPNLPEAFEVRDGRIVAKA